MATGLGRWEVNTVGASSAVEIDNEVARNGRQSAKFTAEDGASAEASITRRFTRPITGRIGIEISALVRTNDATTGQYFELLVTDNNATINAKHTFAIIWDLDGETLARQNQTDTTIILSSAVFSGNLTVDGNWCQLKLVVDTSIHQYEKMLFNSQQVNQRGFESQSVSYDTTEGDRLLVKIIVHGGSGGQTIVNVDDIIFTQNEPPFIT